MTLSSLWTSLGFTALVAINPAHAVEKITKVGVLAPLAGGSVADRSEMVDSTKLAVDEINAAGGVAGYKLQVVVGDPQNMSMESVPSGKLKLPNKKVALISTDNPYSKSIMHGLKKSFEEDGWTVTSADLLPTDEIGDWRTFLVKVRQDNPAVIIDTDRRADAKFQTQFREQPTNSLIFIQYAPHIPEFLKLTSEKGTGGIYNFIGGTLPKGPRTAKIKKKFQAKFGYEPGSSSGPAVYEEVMLYADALKKVGDSKNRLAIGKAVGETNKPTAQGELSFDPKTHLAVQSDDDFSDPVLPTVGRQAGAVFSAAACRRRVPRAALDKAIKLRPLGVAAWLASTG